MCNVTHLELEDLQQFIENLKEVDFRGDVQLWITKKLADAITDLERDNYNTHDSMGAAAAERFAELESRIAKLESAERSRSSGYLWPGG